MDESTKEFKEALDIWRKLEALTEEGNELAIIQILMDIIAQTK